MSAVSSVVAYRDVSGVAGDALIAARGEHELHFADPQSAAAFRGWMVGMPVNVPLWLILRCYGLI